MIRTEKRVSVSFGKQDLKELDTLSEYFNETRTQVIKRAIILLNYVTFVHTDTKEALKRN